MYGEDGRLGVITVGSLEEVLAEGVAAGVPGLCAVVVDSSGIVDLQAVGVRRAGTLDAITTNDRFHLGSNTKAIVATLTACLVEGGFLEWETSIGEVFADLGDRILVPYRGVTMAMLLGHLGGIPPYTDDEAADFVLPDLIELPRPLDVAAFARWIICFRPPLVEPGSAFSYSNAGYAIVAAMLEAIAGERWDGLVRERVFEPYGIDGKVGESWPGRNDPDQPWGHLIGNGTAVPHPPDGDYQLEQFLAPAGDASMSMPNYGRFLQMHLAGLRGEDTLVPADTIRFLHNGGEIGPGLGWGVTRVGSLERLGIFSTHAGSAGTFVVAAAVSHEHDRAFALALNAGLETQYGDWLKTMIEMHLGG